jgi:hypothetical protein
MRVSIHLSVLVLLVAQLLACSALLLVDAGRVTSWETAPGETFSVLMGFSEPPTSDGPSCTEVTGNADGNGLAAHFCGSVFHMNECDLFNGSTTQTYQWTSAPWGVQHLEYDLQQVSVYTPVFAGLNISGNMSGGSLTSNRQPLQGYVAALDGTWYLAVDVLLDQAPGYTFDANITVEFFVAQAARKYMRVGASYGCVNRLAPLPYLAKPTFRGFQMVINTDMLNAHGSGRYYVFLRNRFPGVLPFKHYSEISADFSCADQSICGATVLAKRSKTTIRSWPPVVDSLQLAL